MCYSKLAIRDQLCKTYQSIPKLSDYLGLAPPRPLWRLLVFSETEIMFVAHLEVVN